MDLELVRQMPVFRGFSDSQFADFLNDAVEVALEPGQVLFRDGDDVTGMYVVVEGQVEISKLVFGREIHMRRDGEGAMVGECAVLTRSQHVITVRAVEPTRLLRWPPEAFEETLRAEPCLDAMLQTMSRRLRDIEALVRQQEKLTALGRLAAGLAHELNNPASAGSRAASEFLEGLREMQARLFKPALMRMTPEQVEFFRRVQDAILERSASPDRLDPLDQADREDALAGWLEDQGIEDAYTLVPRLAGVRVTVEELERLREGVGEEAFPDALRWADGLLTVAESASIVLQSTTQISDLVGAVKSYAYMDRTPLQEVDVHEGLEATLVMLHHKVGAIEVVRDYDRSLPKVPAYGGDLNQVWTNLIDNAIDALEGQGTIRIRTSREGEHVAVAITDSGPGISPEAQGHLFEPFFTTKPVGKGTGLGLDIVHRLVVDRHGGEVRVSSQPGETRFLVLLPLRHDEALAAAG